MRIPLPEQVTELIQILQHHGHEAYAVGGCVRDVLLGKTPDDWDVTTSAKPEQVKSLFRRTVDTGIAHGTVTVLLGDEAYEVTTYREDGEYEDGRHPRQVTFVPNLEEDLLRRDFTINAMAYNDRDGLVDLYGGIEDLEEGCIRCVGVPTARFGEDALRMLRAIRFSAQTGFYIEDATLRAIGEMHGNIRKVSGERIRVEVVKLLMSDYPQNMELACETGLCEDILPEFQRLAETPLGERRASGTYGDKALQLVALVPRDKVLRLAAAFAYLGKDDPKDGAEQTEQAMRRLKFDNDTMKKVTILVAHFADPVFADEAKIRKSLHELGEELFFARLQLRYAEASMLPDRDEKTMLLVKEVGALAEQILERGDCISLSQLAVTGKDLMALGLGQGPVIGRSLKQLLNLVLQDPRRNNRDYLLQQAKLYK